MNKVIIFNPRSANSKHRIPNSILQVGASIHGKYDYVFVDGNMESDPWKTIEGYLQTGDFKYFGTTVMPGPQLRQAIPYAQTVRENFPEVINIWGGYFASNQFKVIMESGWVDYIINGPGDKAFPALLDALENDQSVKQIENLIYQEEEQIIRTPKAHLFDQDSLPDLPYEKLNQHYSLTNYLGKTFLGNKTAAYHSSIGCPFYLFFLCGSTHLQC
jgi:anaerobic magnesium-protoporphyrin IX monomethyl ester cyclase